MVASFFPGGAISALETHSAPPSGEPAIKLPASQLTVAASRSSALYATGEAPVFQIHRSQSEAPSSAPVSLRWQLLNNGEQSAAEGVATIAAPSTLIAPASLDTSLPGFLLLAVNYADAHDAPPWLAGAGIAPLEIRAGLKRPEDFDQFWSTQREELAKVPVRVRLTPVAAPRAASERRDIEVFDLQADAVGEAPVSGYLARPRANRTSKNSGTQRLPAILTLHGAGVRSSLKQVASEWAQSGFLALDINAHGLPNGQPAEFYTQLAKGDLKGYQHFGRQSRDHFYFRTMFLRVLRALDILATQPEWDGKTLVVYGSSQGAAQAIVGAALDPRVSFLIAGVPAMCDHGGALAGRSAGWPKLIPTLPNSNNAPDPAVLATAGYYDMAHFATRVTAPARFTVGFIDTVCPPASVYAAYNALPGQKEIFNDIHAKHENTPAAKAWFRAAALHHAGLQTTEAQP